MRRDDLLKAAHPTENELSEYLAGLLPRHKAAQVEEHLARCDECLGAIVAAHESSGDRNRPLTMIERIRSMIKKINPYLILAIASFALSFIIPRYFIQLLVATLLLGIKWVVDSKSTKMLVMIYEAWKTGGEKEASKVLERLGNKL